MNLIKIEIDLGLGIQIKVFFYDYVVRQRDEICRSGELLHSPALLFSINDLINNVEALRQTKLLKEQQEDQQQQQQQQSQETQSLEGNESLTTSNEQTYRVGEYVYLSNDDKDLNPAIICIDKLWTNEQGQQMCYGVVFLYPSETYHVSTRKFLEKEVFKSDTYQRVPLATIKSRCCVLNIRDYLKYKPEGSFFYNF